MYSRFMILSAVLGLTAAPLAAQTDLGFRAGVGLARMDFSGVAYAPCPPETDCHSAPDDWSLSPLISADVRHATGVLSFRVSFTYAVKGGAGSGGRYANGTPSSGTQRLHFLQFSPLLEANMPWDARGRFAVSLLFGPWAALRVGCSVAGALAAGCYTDEMPDAGVAFGGGIHYTVASTLTITAESIYHWGLVPNAGGGLTRLVAVQVGATIH
ncbi:hypothetical protein [Candidatus Palauibacter sp.]|uniref:hypothetical protein n=1 Tax=Candidatus Palauibacter sp. TaxID=3101350 RepID=UPI003B027F07